MGNSHRDIQKIKKYHSRLAFICYVCFQGMVRILALISPYLTELLIDSITKDEESLLLYSLLLIGETVLYMAFLTLAYYTKSCYENACIIEKKKEFMERMMQAPLKQIQKNGSGYYLQRFKTNMEGCRDFLINKPVNFCLNFLYMIGILFLMLRINVKYALTLLCVFPVMALLYVYLSRKIRSVAKECEEVDEKANTLLEELYACNYTIRTSGAEEWYAGRTEPVLADSFLKNREYNRLEAVYDYFLITGLLNFVGILVYAIGGKLTFLGEISYGMIIAMSLYYSKLWTPLEFYLDYPKQYARYRVHRDRLNEVLDYSTEQKGEAEADMFRELELLDISYTIGDTLVFDGLSLSVQAGDHISVTGGNGSGKTTLANMMAAILDDYTGVIRYNKTDYRELDAKSIRRHICLIPARPELFSGSIRENILMGSEREIPPVVMDALNRKKLSLDFILQENASNVSSGEAKLIQLARGFCRDADLYMIDEPLNFIDDEYVEMIMKAIKEFFAEKTLMIISHDERALRVCTKNYILDNHILTQQ